ncbi:HTH-type transcriptional repressor RspR [bacterium HR10]|nr:HTH-type transcriptional repressor RspR [bacterium HR10]
MRGSRSTNPGQRRVLSDGIYDQLKAEIITGALKPGHYFSETELARRFHVSRTPIREACALLEREGLLQSLPYKGYLVPPITFEDLQKLYQVQLIVESACAELAARAVDPEHLAMLEQLCQTSYTFEDRKSYFAFIRANFRFHTLIAEATGNDLLLEIVLDVENKLQRFFYQTIGLGAYGPLLVEEHTAIVHALREGDPHRARRAMERHIQNTKERTSKLFLK